MPIDRKSLSPPKNNQDFESWCQRIYSRKLNAQGLQHYGGNGEKQHGVDLVGFNVDGDFVTVQAKLRNNGKLSVKEIDDDLSAAIEKFDDITLFLIATTQRRAKNLLDHVLKLNREYRDKGVVIKIEFWDEIEDFFHESINLDLLNDYLGISEFGVTNVQMSTHVEQIKLHVDNAFAAASTTENSFDKQITESFEFTKQGKPGTTFDLLTRFKEEEWGQLDDRLRFRVLANIGNALFGLDKFTEAAEYWTKAYEYQKTPVAELHYARALQFGGKTAEAIASVHRIIDIEPENQSAYAVLIHVNGELGYPAILELIPDAMRSKAEVALALSYKALDEGDNEHGEQHARDAVADEPEWAVAKTNLAAILLGKMKGRLQLDLDGNPINLDMERLEEARAMLNEVVDQATKLSPYSLGMARYNRSTTNFMLGDNTAGIADLEAAHRLLPNDSNILATYASRHKKLGNQEASIRLLEEAHVNAKNDPGIGLLLALELANLNDKDNLDRAVGIVESNLDSVASETSERKFDYLQALCELRRLSKPEQYMSAGTLTDDLSGFLSDRDFRVLVAEQHRKLGEMEFAKNEAEDVAESNDDQMNEVVAHSLGYTLVACGNSELATQLLENFANPNVLTRCTYQYLQAADLSGNSGSILNYCSSLVDSGCDDKMVLHLLTDRRQEYEDYAGAISVLDKWLEYFPDDLKPKIWKGILSKLSENQAGVELAVQSLPSPENIPFEFLEESVLLKNQSTEGMSVEWAYELWRSNSNAETAWKALASRIFFHRASNSEGVSIPDKVRPGVAVQIKIEHGDTRWIWVRNGDAKSDLGEFDIESELGKQIHGYQVGHIFEFKRSFQSSKAEIVAIAHGALIAAQNCMDQWEERFPESAFVQAFKVNSASPEPTQKELDRAIQPLLEMAKRREQHTNAAVEKYQAFRLSTWLFSVSISRSQWQSIGGLLIDETVVFLDADSNDLYRMIQTASSSRGLVLDLTSLFFIIKLDVLSVVLDEFDVEIPRRLLNTLLEELQNLKNSSRSTSSLHAVGGKPVVVDTDENAVQKEYEVLEAGIELLRSKAKIVDGYALSKLDIEVSKTLTAAYGPAGARSIAHAAENGTLLCQDDGVFSQLATQVGVSRVTTGAVIESMRIAGAITKAKADKLVAKLLQWKALCVPLRGGVIVEYCKLQSWDPGSSKIDSILSMFEDPSSSQSQLAVFFLEIAKSLWSHDGALNRIEILRLVLSKLDKRSDGRVIMQGILGAVDQIFGLDVISASGVSGVISNQLQTPLSLEPKSLVIDP